VDLNRSNIYVWCLLAFQAGCVNAGGFLAAHRFVTHTTGFATHFGFELANQHEGAALGMLSVPIFFLFGAMITSYFVDLPLAAGQKANYALPSFLIFSCISFTTLLGEFGHFGTFGTELTIKHDYLFLVLLCLASGLQNALITNSQGVVVRTTHLTGVTTDLAVGLVRTFFGERRMSPQRIAHDRLATKARAGIIVSFVLGSTISSYFFLKAQYLGFLIPACTSLLLLAYFLKKTDNPLINKLGVTS